MLMRIAAAVCAALILTPTTTRAADPTPDAHVVFRATFDSSDALADWAGDGGRLVREPDGTTALLVEQPRPGGTLTRRYRLPVDALQGLITITARLKAEDVAPPPQSWNGIKVMLVLETDHGTDYPQLRLPTGSFDWSIARDTLRLPSDLRGATLTVGLEQCAGRVWFDQIEIVSGRVVPGDTGQYGRFDDYSLPRLRGVMAGPQFREQDIADLASWGVNQVRWQLNWTPMKQAETWAQDIDAFEKWLDGALQQADLAIDACERHGIHVLLDLHCPPGGRINGDVCRLFTEKKYQDQFLDIWRRIATRYRGREIIYAYDLVNEPVEPSILPDGLMSWTELATAATRVIREIDPGKPVVFEPGPWGACHGFDSMAPLPVDRVIYSFHMYLPHAFTHQFQKKDRYPDGLVYPGAIDGRFWDKEALRAAMRPAIDFQQEFQVPMYVGEFSAIRWAPDDSAYRWLRDVIELFEEYEWDWSYHAFREFHGWSVEHTDDERDTRPSATPTNRERLLRSWFEKNARP